MLLDIQKSGKDIIIDELNKENSTAFLSSDFDFSDPVEIKELGTTRNTQLTVTANAGSNFYGSRNVIYTRMDLVTIFTDIGNPIISKTARKLSDIIPDINTAYGISLKI